MYNLKFNKLVICGLVSCLLCLNCVSGQNSDKKDDDNDNTQGTTVTQSSIVSKSCSKNTLKRVDELLAKVTTYGNSGRKFPENTEQLPKYCNESKNYVESIESLNKRCIEGLASRVLTVAIFTVKTVIKQLCRKNNKLLPEYFEAAKCINTVQSKVGKCFSKSIDHLLGMQLASENKKIPMACCELPKLRECIEDTQRDVQFCTTKNIESTNRFVDSIIGNSVNLLACGDYVESADKCDRFSVPKKRRQQRRPRSLVMAFLHLIESFPEEKD